MGDPNYDVMETEGVPVKMWTRGVQVEDEAREQLRKIARLPIVFSHVAAMPDVHLGHGAAVGSVVPTLGAIIPSAVGVDLGCGMLALRTSLRAKDLPDTLAPMRAAIEAAIPHGRTNNGAAGDRGAWSDVPKKVGDTWANLVGEYDQLCERHPKMRAYNTVGHLGTLGTGNHFVEVCLGEDQAVWVMLHSGSRGAGNRIGSYFIELAKNDMREAHGNLPEDENLAYLTEGTKHFNDYRQAVSWAQRYAYLNRDIMMERALDAIGRSLGPEACVDVEEIVPGGGVTAINCHHNYVQDEVHFGQRVYVTRKGAVSAKAGQFGVIPGSMGAKSFIVRGKGNVDSFTSCSHGAGRAMSRNAAKKRFTLEDHAKATEGVECRKDVDVIDETPGSYKPIDDVMRAQSDLVDVVATIKQILCVKG